MLRKVQMHTKPRYTHLCTKTKHLTDMRCSEKNYLKLLQLYQPHIFLKSKISSAILTMTTNR